MSGLPGWLRNAVALCAAFMFVAAALWLINDSFRGDWFVAEFISRGPSAYARIMVDRRTGTTCEVIGRPGAQSILDPTQDTRPFWVCNQRPRAGASFMPEG